MSGEDKSKLLDEVYEKAEEDREEVKAPPKRRDSIGGKRGICARFGRCLATNSTIVMILVYLLIGQLFYGPHEDWSILNTMFFTIFTLTTVGYGCPDCPSSQKSRLFTAIYALAGIALVASIMLGALEKAMADADDMANLEQLDKVEEISETMNEEQKASNKAAKARKGKLLRMVGMMLGLILHVAIVTAGIKSLEELDTWVDAFYSCGQTLTTVGYGDISPSKDSTKMFACIYMPSLVVHFGLCVNACMGYALALMASNKEVLEMEAEEDAEENHNSGMTIKQILKQIEKDKDGRVYPLSFLKFMAQKSCDVSDGCFLKIASRFRELDVDNSGSLDKVDVARLAQMLQ